MNENVVMMLIVVLALVTIPLAMTFYSLYKTDYKWCLTECAGLCDELDCIKECNRHFETIGNCSLDNRGDER